MENVQRKHRENSIFGSNGAPCESTVRRLMTKFEAISSVLMMKSPGRKRSCRTEEQLEHDSVTVSPGKSIR